MSLRTLLLVFLVASPCAHGMNWQKTAPSSNIIDTRDDTLYPEEPLRLISRYGEVAEQGKMPFLCPGLKLVRQSTVDLGRKIVAVKTPLKLKQEFNDEMKIENLNAGSVNQRGSGDACSGSKKSAVLIITINRNGLRHYVGLVRDLHGASYTLAKKILSDIAAQNARPSLGDRINNSISNCPRYTADFQQAISVYQKQVQTLLLYYQEMLTGLEDKLAKVNAINCSSIGAAGSGSTSSTISGSARKANVPLPPARPKGL